LLGGEVFDGFCVEFSGRGRRFENLDVFIDWEISALMISGRVRGLGCTMGY
jgi:hypothetical protein